MPHTDSRGSDELNRALSDARVDAVREALLERGVSEERLRAQGAGESYPVATNGTVAGRQQNRRVELVFSDEEGRFRQAAVERGAPAASLR